MEAVVCPCRSLTGSMLHFLTLKVLHARSTGPTVGLTPHGQEQDHDTWGSHQQHFLTPTLPGISEFYYSSKLDQKFQERRSQHYHILVSTYLLPNIITGRTKQLDKYRNCPMINHHLGILRSSRCYVRESPCSLKLTKQTNFTSNQSRNQIPSKLHYATRKLQMQGIKQNLKLREIFSNKKLHKSRHNSSLNNFLNGRTALYTIE